MEVRSQAPQPVIQCYHSIVNGKATKQLYYSFTPLSEYFSGKNLQSYNFSKSISEFGGSFSFSLKESLETQKYNFENQDILFMDAVQPLDIIVISESGDINRVDFIGVVTKISIGGTASNLNKTINISGKSIEWLFSYYNIDADIRAVIFENKSANNVFKLALSNKRGEEGIAVKDVVLAAYEMFESVVNPDYSKENQVNNKLLSIKSVTNFQIGEIIKIWYGKDFVETSKDTFYFPISSNMFESGKINVIDYIKKLLPPPIYEIFGNINNFGKPIIIVRKVPFNNPVPVAKIDPVLLTDFTLTRGCEEVYTAFMPYIEGTSLSPEFYMNLTTAESMKEKGYDCAKKNPEKVKLYGYQLLTCSFAGYNSNLIDGETFDKKGIQDLADEMAEWFGSLDDMYSGDITIVNMAEEKKAKIGEWISFADGFFYVDSETHSWNFGDNPMINYQISRGGKYPYGVFQKLTNISAAYKEFD